MYFSPVGRPHFKLHVLAKLILHLWDLKVDIVLFLHEFFIAGVEGPSLPVTALGIFVLLSEGGREGGRRVSGGNGLGRTIKWTVGVVWERG